MPLSRLYSCTPYPSFHHSIIPSFHHSILLHYTIKSERKECPNRTSFIVFLSFFWGNYVFGGKLIEELKYLNIEVFLKINSNCFVLSRHGWYLSGARRKFISLRWIYNFNFNQQRSNTILMFIICDNYGVLHLLNFAYFGSLTCLINRFHCIVLYINEVIHCILLYDSEDIPCLFV